MRPSVRGGTYRLAAATVLIAVAAFSTVGCGSKQPAKTVAKPPVVATESVTPTESVVPTESVAPTVAPPAAPPKASTIWPAQVGTFAGKFKGPTWYPKSLPKGLKLDSVDVLELEPGSGLVCDSYFVAGDVEIDLLQGSPKTREYDIVSVGKVPWGTETADVVYEDPEDNTSPKMIVYSAKGTLAELSGGATFEQLKSVAAAMVLVK